MSLDGIEYFPQEFATKAYIQKMFDKKTKALRLLKKKKSAGIASDDDSKLIDDKVHVTT